MFNVNRLILLAFVLVVGVSASLARGQAGERAAGAWDGAEYRLAQTLPNWAQGLSGATSKGEETKGEAAGKAGSDAPAEGAAQTAGRARPRRWLRPRSFRHNWKKSCSRSGGLLDCSKTMRKPSNG